MRVTYVRVGYGKAVIRVTVQLRSGELRGRVWNTFEPSTLTPLDRPLSHFWACPLWQFWTVRFNTFRPSTFTFSHRQVWNFRTVQFDSFGRSTLTLRFIPRNHPLLVEWPSTLTHDCPLWLKRPSTMVLDRPLWLKWSSSLAQDRPLLDGPSTFGRTVQFKGRPLWTWLPIFWKFQNL